MRNRSVKSYQDGAEPLILAHRGGAGEAPENSLQAFQSAVDAGLTHLETDVRVSAEGTLYLHHGASSLIPNQPYKFKGAHEPPTLPQLFDAFPDCLFAIDPKHDLAIEPLARLIADRELADRICIGSSFEARTERTAALHGSSKCLGVNKTGSKIRQA